MKTNYRLNSFSVKIFTIGILYSLILLFIALLLIYRSENTLKQNYQYIEKSLNKLEYNNALQVAASNNAIDSVKKILTYEFNQDSFLKAILIKKSGNLISYYGDLSFSEAKNFNIENHEDLKSITKDYPNEVSAEYLVSLKKMDKEIDLLAHKNSDNIFIKYNFFKLTIKSFFLSLILLVIFLCFKLLFNSVNGILTESRKKSKELHDLLSSSVQIAIFSKIVLAFINNNKKLSTTGEAEVIVNQANAFLFMDAYNREVIHNSNLSFGPINAMECLENAINYLVCSGTEIGSLLEIQNFNGKTNVIGNISLLSRVFQNLLKNSYEAIFHDPSIITLKIKTEDKLTCFSISNKGSFRKNYLKYGHSSKSSNRGKGLSIVTESLKLMDSKLSVKQLDNHVTFSFSLKNADFQNEV